MPLQAVEIEITGIYHRVGEVIRSVEPGEYAIGAGRAFGEVPYGVVFAWPKKVGSWCTIQAETVNAAGSTTSRFGNKDLLATIRTHRFGQSPLAQSIDSGGFDDKWVLTGSVPKDYSLRLLLSFDTSNEDFVRFSAAAPETGLLRIELDAYYFDNSLPQPLTQRIALLLKPCTPVATSEVLMSLDIGNTDSTVAILSPFRRWATGDIPMLTAVEASNRRLCIGKSHAGGVPLPSNLRFDTIRSWVRAEDPWPNTRTFPDPVNHPDDDREIALDYAICGLGNIGEGKSRSVIMGAKRMVSSRPVSRLKDKAVYGTVPVFTTHKIIAEANDSSRKSDSIEATIHMDVRAPLELLACRIFEFFREDQRAWPSKIAMTYPTTYSRFELQALKRAVQKGWLRMQAARQAPGLDFTSPEPVLRETVRRLRPVVAGQLDLDTQSRDPLIHLLLDEATAASFFFLYRKIFEQNVGGLAGFHYHYQRGLNMLLFDCGGGTTDIALVRAVVEENLRTLRITVLRRSGVRDFGGDNITRQVCLLLKAKLQRHLAANRGGYKDLPELPNAPAQLPTDDDGWREYAADLNGFIDKMRRLDPLDTLVPTRTIPDRPTTENIRSAALELWRLGERMKLEFSKTEPDSNNPVMEVKLPPLSGDTNALTRSIFPEDSNKQAALKRELGNLTIARAEVEALVYEPVIRSIANCNKLIAEVFHKRVGDDAIPDEVHWVVASGNAVRFPMLQRLLQQRLAVSFLDDPHRFTFDPVNAKDATAKGAVLALDAMEGQAQQIDVRFDSDLADRLPYNIGYRTLTVNKYKTLFEEHKLYSELKARKPVEIKVVDLPAPSAAPGAANALSGDGGSNVAKAGENNQHLKLERQFPGDPGFSEFLDFEFPEGIKGDTLCVSYDDESEFEFKVVDAKGNVGIGRDLTAGEIYRHPAQRGDI